MKFVVSEWGFTKEFDSLEEAQEYCIINNLIDGEEGILWIISENREELDELISDDRINFQSTRFKHLDSPNNWIWENIFRVWENATQTEQDGQEDFEEKFNVRKNKIK